MFTQHKVTNAVNTNGCLVGTNDRGALSIFAPSLSHLLTHVKNAYPTPQQEGSSATRKERRSQFYAFETYEEAVDVYTNRPWEVVKFKAVDHTLLSPTESGSSVYFDVTGDYLDIGRFLDGEPEQFGNATLGNPRGIFITIYASAMAAYYIDEEILRHKQERIVALIDWLESSNIRTRLIAINDNECGYIETVLKDYHDSVNLNPIAVAFHPDYLRRVIFRVKEYSATWNSGYGSSVSNIKVDEGGLSIQIPSNQDSIEAVDNHFDNLIKQVADRIAEGEINCVVT